VVVVGDPEGKMRDGYLFTTELQAGVSWAITPLAWRWSSAVRFGASKQVLDSEASQHGCQERVAKVAPWVWSMQSVIMGWYVPAGHDWPEAQERRARMGPWDSEGSLRHRIQVLQRATLNATINPNSAAHAQVRELGQTLQNWALLAA
jgi:hypothetical protein